MGNTCIGLTMPPWPHEAGKRLHLLDTKEMGWLQASSVQFLKIQITIEQY